MSDWEAISKKVRAGGQGTVTPVRHRQSGVLGGLKQLHPEQASRTERRYRFLTEVSALRVLGGSGVPAVLDANEVDWQNKDTELYLVMEWIEGRTLSDLTARRAATLSEAIDAMSNICSTLEICHELGILHRDLKPDNIIMRNGSWSEPVLVDFGISWTRPVDDKDHAYHTPVGQELGNRFLRLPEFAPGGDHYESRSDVSMAVGLLFFMLTGQQPRVLVDGSGRLPHEAHDSAISEELRTSTSWQKIRRIFHVGFQTRLSQRFQSVAEFRARLVIDQEPIMDDSARELEEASALLQEVFEGVNARRVAEVGDIMGSIQNLVWERLFSVLQANRLTAGGQGPTFFDNGQTNAFNLTISRESISEPSVHVRHLIRFNAERLEASVEYETGSPDTYYEGPSADKDGLEEAALENTTAMCAKLIILLHKKLLLS